MVTTFTDNFNVRVQDSTVVYGSGPAFLYNTLIPFDGGTSTFNSMIDTSAAEVYQNVLMYLKMEDMTSTGLDMTRAVSDTATNELALEYPVMPDSNGFPLGTFKFYYDGTSPSLISYSSI